MKTDPPSSESSPGQEKKHLGAAVRWSPVLLLAAGLLIAGNALPLEYMLGRLDASIEEAGAWGPIVYALCYVIATLLMIPGSVLTIFAGASFGLFWGTITVSIGSTVGAALAFLIARLLARQRISKMLEHRPWLGAVNKALSEGGWKTVALMRLSPAIPFNIQNYLWGITPVGFWACLLSSWIAMLPGTFLYIYLGDTSREAVGAAAAGEPLETARWIFRAAGLLATLVVTIYIARLARRQLGELGDI